MTEIELNDVLEYLRTHELDLDICKEIINITNEQMGKSKIIVFKDFFKAMKKRIEEKIGQFQYSWKISSIEVLEKRLDREIGEYFDPRIASSKGQRRLIDLVDIANQAMFVWIRRMKKDDPEDFFDFYNEVIRKYNM